MHQTVYHMTYFQAVAIGLLQGITELFPVSSLGHTVLVPSWIGGTWATLVRQESEAESPYLAFVVGLHLATAVVLLGFYIREWVRLVVGFFRSLARRKAVRDDERLAWLIVIATIPVGLLGLLLEHPFRVLFAKPLAAAFFLTLNGIILGTGEWYRRHRSPAVPSPLVPPPISSPVASSPVASAPGVPAPGVPAPGASSPGVPALAVPAVQPSQDDRIVPMDEVAERELSRIGGTSAVVIGAAQALALLAGVSREGIAMVGGLFRGLNNENAMRFSFLLSTPVIFAAGALKIPDLMGTLGNGIRLEVVAGSIAAGATSLFAVLFLSRYFKTRTLVPFAVYSLLFGLASVVRFGVF